MTWTKLPALERPSHRGCLNCPPKPVGPLNLHGYYHPGFGSLTVTCDGEERLYDVHGTIERPLMRAENMARKDPDRDWRMRVDGPLDGAVYQRHGHGEWYMVESLGGFA